MTVTARVSIVPFSVEPSSVRRTVLGMLYRAGASHLGSNMSIIEMLIAAYSSVDVEAIRRGLRSRSRIIVSKGHCAAAVYATLAHFGILDDAALETYHSDGSLLAGHVSHAVHGVEHSTGALGHGLPVAVGCALGLRAIGAHEASVISLLGDGEIQEGSNWEALMLARHHNLTNLITMIDNNRISSITATADVLDMNPLAERFSGFGFQVLEVDGHDIAALTRSIDDLRRRSQLGVMICNTTKGHGVPFAEDQPIWHYRSLSESLYREAITNLAPAEGTVDGTL